MRGNKDLGDWEVLSVAQKDGLRNTVRNIPMPEKIIFRVLSEILK